MDFKLKEKRWNTDIENEINEKWKQEKLYKFNKNTEKEIITIDNPPAYPSGHWHPGSATGYSYIDMIARYERMNGKEINFPYCLDRNGLPIEMAVEKKYKKSAHDYDREKFLKLCEQTISEFGEEIRTGYEKLGISVDYENYYYTDMEEYRKLTQATFIELYKKGLIYEDDRPTNWCTGCKTTIADSEIEYNEGTIKLNKLKFKVKETGEEIEIATTRPELLCACETVIYNPKDSRYKHLNGKHAITPIYEKEVLIQPHPAASMEYGSGLVMICSYGDSTDVQLFIELGLKPTKAIDKHRKMTEAAGKYAGLTVPEAREKIIKELEETGVLIGQEDTPHRYPICERCHSPVEIIAIKEFYLKQIEFLDKVKEMADKTKFYPAKHKQILFDWIDSVKIDWPISRRRYYATEIPLWYCEKCGELLLPEPGEYYQPWKNNPPEGSKCSKCGGTEFKGETRVFDTWMDSSISNLYVSGYKRDEELFNKTFGKIIRPQGRDIVRTWLYYTMLRNYQLLEQPAFEKVMIHGMGLDEHGKKMSKSKGNFISPEEMLSKYGADAWRLWAASETNMGEDFRISEERIKGASKFLTKLWNLSRFISTFEIKETGELKNTDHWILAELNQLIKQSKEGYEEYNFYIPATRIKEFIWNTFSSNYVEMVKPRAYEGDTGALYTLHTCLKTILKLLAPITPFITDKVYREVYGKTVHLEAFPEENENWNSNFKELTEKIIEFNSMVWKTKKEQGLSLNSEIEGIKIPSELKPFEDDLIKMHKLK